MAAPVIKLYHTTDARLKELKVANGNMVFVKDTHRVYLDLNDIRTCYDGVQIFPTEAERVSAGVLSDGFCYVEDTNVLWRCKDGSWTQLTPDNLSPTFFGTYADFPKHGRQNVLYIDDDALYKWDETSSSYLMVANKTEWQTY